jgi:hypothetical protein
VELILIVCGGRTPLLVRGRNLIPDININMGHGRLESILGSHSIIGIDFSPHKHSKNTAALVSSVCRTVYLDG